MYFFGRKKDKEDKTVTDTEESSLSNMQPVRLPPLKKKNAVTAVDTVIPTEKVRLSLPARKEPLSKASFFVKVALLLMAAVLLVVSVKYLLDFGAMEEEQNRKEHQYASLLDQIDELHYYIESPMDEYYVRKFAWEIFHMVPSDKKVVIIPGEN